MQQKSKALKPGIQFPAKVKQRIHSVKYQFFVRIQTAPLLGPVHYIDIAEDFYVRILKEIGLPNSVEKQDALKSSD